MKLLLDTQIWLWLQTAPERLSPVATDALVDPANTVFLSVASTWEMAIKSAAGKLFLPRSLREVVSESLATDDLRALPVDNRHCFELASLPALHRDPFDRILVAQALVDGLTLVTHDPMFERYGVSVLST